MSVGKLIDELGGTTALAEGIGAEPPVVSNWRARGRIPADNWPAIVDFAGKAGVKGITFERLASAQARRTAEARA